MGGLPTTRENSGISKFDIIVPAPITEFFLITVPPKITEWEPMNTFSSMIIGFLWVFFCLPIVFICESAQLIETKDAFGNLIKKKIIGISIKPATDEINQKKLGPVSAIYYSIQEVWFVCKTTLSYVGSMLTGKADTSQLGGPIKIAKISGQVAEFGFLAFITTIAYISISLGSVS